MNIFGVAMLRAVPVCLFVQTVIFAVLTKGARKKLVVFPKGKWRDTDGNEYDGNTEELLNAPVDKLLWFRRIK